MIIIDSDGGCFGTGHNKNGALGIPDAMGEVSKFTPIPNSSPMFKISAGSRFSLFLKPDGRLFSTGRDLLNGLGKKIG